MENPLMYDPDLMLEILKVVKAEATPRGFFFDESEAEKMKRPLNEIEYNLDQANQMGLIRVGPSRYNGPLSIVGLTPSGHDFLEHSKHKNEVDASSARSSEPIIIVKPTFMGMSINLNELWRRASSRWNNR
jgi:hypothetical protein